MKPIIFALAALALGTTATAEPEAAGDCESRFGPVGLYGRSDVGVEARTMGPNCADAVAVLMLRDGEGHLLYSFSAPVEHVFGLAGMANATQMRIALADWLGAAPDAPLSNTSDLPDWPDGGELPGRAGFPFYPETWVTREEYAAIRQAERVMFCHVQGMESVLCLQLRDGIAEIVGVQVFPG